MSTLLSKRQSTISINIIAAFLILALLRLLPFNFVASTLIGHDVVIDNREGNAINFINYISVTFFFFLILIKLPIIKAKWSELWPFLILLAIYLGNWGFAPYVNTSWIMYQSAFILIAALIHLLLSGQTHLSYEIALKQGGFMLFTSACILFFSLVLICMYSQFSVSYIIAEFNDSFINSVNGFGLMKQYYGYVIGFMVLYTVFVLEKMWIKVVMVLLAIFTGFGIRSFLIGIAAVFFVRNINSPTKVLLSLLLISSITFFLWEGLIIELLYDTRFYAYMNGWDIIHKFPFGVGLGGYPVYTEINNNDLFASFFTLDAALNYVPNSPESDIVHVFGSLGLWAGLLHIGIQLRLVFLGIAHKAKMFPFEKCMFYFFVFMTAFGISEDTLFTVSYWIFFGVTSGTIASVIKRNKYA